MWKGLFLALSALTASADAFAQGADPLGGAFGAIEAAMSPVEALQQAEMLSSNLNALAAQRPGVVDTYVLSVSLWNDPVFESEAREASVILARHFDAADRTLVLSAGKRGGSRSFPSATPNNIQAALGKIGRTINPLEDLVVVFMTSHGAPDGAMAIQETGRMGGRLRPEHLRASLAAAGIRTKVVIISACFSGHFILPFSDPNTVVLTAAAADKTSFGCEPSRDWTYFGDALFNNALRGGSGLVSAYDESLGLISKWEADLRAQYDALPASRKDAERRPEPSNPQKHVGEAVAELLAKIEPFGRAVSCAGNLSVAFDRARAGRPLQGLADAQRIQTARSDLEARAVQLASAVNKTPQDVARAISASSAALLAVAGKQSEQLAVHADKCMSFNPTTG